MNLHRTVGIAFTCLAGDSGQNCGAKNILFSAFLFYIFHWKCFFKQYILITVNLLPYPPRSSPTLHPSISVPPLLSLPLSLKSNRQKKNIKHRKYIFKNIFEISITFRMFSAVEALPGSVVNSGCQSIVWKQL